MIEVAVVVAVVVVTAVGPLWEGLGDAVELFWAIALD